VEEGLESIITIIIIDTMTGLEVLAVIGLNQNGTDGIRKYGKNIIGQEKQWKHQNPKS
jgi:hypothetical protein